VSPNLSIVIRETLVNPILAIRQLVVKKHTFVSQHQINVAYLLVVPLDVSIPPKLVPRLTNALLVNATQLLDPVLIPQSPATMVMLVRMIVVILSLAPVCINQWTVLLLTSVQQVFVLLENVPLLLFHVMIKSIVLRMLVILLLAVRIPLIIPIVPPQTLACCVPVILKKDV